MTETLDGVARSTHTGASVGQVAYETMRDSIIEMRFRPGQRVTEREFIELTGASRATVREAINRLVGDGMLDVEQSNRTFVPMHSIDEADELYEIRASLEAIITERFALRASADERRELDVAYAAYATAADATTRMVAKDRFYETLGLHSPMVSELLARLHARIALLRRVSLMAPGRHQESVAEVGEIVEAIDSGNAALAKDLTLKHIARARDAVVEALTTSPWLTRT